MEVFKSNHNKLYQEIKKDEGEKIVGEMDKYVSIKNKKENVSKLFNFFNIIKNKNL